MRSIAKICCSLFFKLRQRGADRWQVVTVQSFMNVINERLLFQSKKFKKRLTTRKNICMIYEMPLNEAP
ncbi:MAG: hypothetical protein BHW08_11195 [Clostridium sp. CAG:12237_41]|nr:MAG: hypothetical protein BHW08_11195 [Clostridium sp. CAG:12237_41]